MSSRVIEKYRENAVIYHEQELCKQKCTELLERTSMPNGLLPLDDFIEVGYNESAGFVWMKQKKAKERNFRSVNRLVWFDTVVMAFAEKHHFKNLTGVMTKELFIWAPVTDISIKDPSSGKISFSSPIGLYRTYPFSAFEIEDDKRVLHINN